MLQSGLCDYSDAYIVVKGTINVADQINVAYDKKLAFKSNIPFISFQTLIIHLCRRLNAEDLDNAVDLDIVMPMYN